MNHRERVLTAIAHREADRCPRDLWATPEIMERLRAHFGVADEESVLRLLDVDLRSFYGPSQAGQSAKALPDGGVVDLWGVKRKVTTVEGSEYRWAYKHLVESPLAGARTARDVESYPGWPDPAAWDFAGVAATCRKFEGYAVVNMGDRLDRTAQLKPAMYLRGVEQIFADLIENEAVAEAIFERVYQYFMEYDRRVFEAARLSPSSPLPPGEGKDEGPYPGSVPLTQPSPGGRGENLIDIFMMGDDFGSQHGPLVSPAMWRRFFKRRFRDYVDLAHSFHIKVMHHTCGSVRALVPEFIDCGLDILQSVQPQAEGMDLGELKREFGRDIAFHGSIDIQGALPHGSPADVRREVATRMSAGKPGGGFIISTAHNIMPDTPTGNILALFDAYREYGSYP